MYNYSYLAGTFSVQKNKILYLMQYAHPGLENTWLLTDKQANLLAGVQN